MLFDTQFSFNSYQETLKSHGFEIIETREESNNLKKSYQKLCKVLERKIKERENNNFLKKYISLLHAYKKFIEAIENEEVGWAIYVCKKI